MDWGSIGVFSRTSQLLLIGTRVFRMASVKAAAKLFLIHASPSDTSALFRSVKTYLTVELGVARCNLKRFAVSVTRTTLGPAERTGPMLRHYSYTTRT